MNTTFPATAEPTAQKPWVNRRASVQSALTPLLLAIAITVPLVLFTGLAGPLGAYLAFVLSYVFTSFVTGLRQDKVRGINQMMSTLVTVGFVTAFIPWMSILFTVFSRGAGAFYSGYFTNDMATTAADDALNLGGLSHAIVGSAVILGVSSLISIPFGIITAIYITEVRGRLSGLVRVMVQSMSGVPSIVAGLFVFAIMVSGKSFSALAGSVALAILMLPTVARTSEEVLKLVPDELRTSAYALGATQTGTVFRIVLPTARSGLITASMLGIARVAGETAPLILTSFYSANFSRDLTGQSIASLPMYVYQNFSTGTDIALTRAWGGASVLLGIIFLLFVSARVFGRSQKR